MPKTELFVGNLSKQVTRKDIEDVFDKYGRLVRCDVKNKDFGASFCFLEFEAERDAEDALSAENGKDMCGASMVVEWAKGKDNSRGRDGGGFRGGRDGGFRGGQRDGGFRGGRGGGGFGGGGRTLECYQCGERGHFARDCRKGGGGGGRSRGAGGRDDRRDGGRRRYSPNNRSRSRSRS